MSKTLTSTIVLGTTAMFLAGCNSNDYSVHRQSGINRENATRRTSRTTSPARVERTALPALAENGGQQVRPGRQATPRQATAAKRARRARPVPKERWARGDPPVKLRVVLPENVAKRERQGSAVRPG